MSHPFFTLSAKSIPVHHRKTKPSGNVITVPVHFITSTHDAATNRTNSAVKIQKTFRGFLVRNSLNKISQISRQVKEIEEFITHRLDVVKNNEKERLRVNETLMRLLIGLDSVNGVCDGVRECRKKAIISVIRLQEMIDDIVLSGRGDEGLIGNSGNDKVLEGSGDSGEIYESLIGNSEKVRVGDIEKEGLTVLEGPGDGERINELGDGVDEGLIDKGEKVGVLDIQHGPGDNGKIDETGDHVLEGLIDKSNILGVREIEIGNVQESSGGIEKIVQSNDKSKKVQGEVDDATQDMNEEKIEEESEGGSLETRSLIEESTGDSMEELRRNDELDHVGECGGEVKRTDEIKSRVLLGKLMEDNEKMMGLMWELFERNEMQTRILSTLSQRVEQLERAFICERRKRKKKRESVGGLDGKRKCWK